jgi:hypothetical protein
VIATELTFRKFQPGASRFSASGREACAIRSTVPPTGDVDATQKRHRRISGCGCDDDLQRPLER